MSRAGKGKMTIWLLRAGSADGMIAEEVPGPYVERDKKEKEIQEWRKTE